MLQNHIRGLSTQSRRIAFSFLEEGSVLHESGGEIEQKSEGVQDGEGRAFRWHIRMAKRCSCSPLLWTLVLLLGVMIEAIPIYRKRVILYIV